MTEQFRVSLGWATKISARGRGTGEVDAPIWWHGPVSRVTPGVQEWIRKQVPTQPHMTLQELRAQLEEAQQVYLSMGRMWLPLCQLGLPLKKGAPRARAGRASQRSGKSGEKP